MPQDIEQLAAGSSIIPEPDNSEQVSLLFPAIAAFGIACSVPTILITTFNYFVGPMRSELRLSSLQLSQALFWHLIVMVGALPIVGFCVDRYGARPVIRFSAVACGLSFLWISRVSGSTIELYTAFALCSILGAGCTAVPYNRVIVQKFNRHRGLALGISMTGAGLGPIFAPLIRPVILTYGWRTGFVVLGGAMAAIALFASLFAGKNRIAAATAAHGPGLKEALKRADFWNMAVATACLGMVSAGMIAHLTETFGNLGLDPADVPTFQVAIGIASIVGRIGGGALMDRYPAKLVAASAAAIGALGLAAIGRGISTHLALIVTGLAFGLCLGAEGQATSFLSRQYFGLNRFARVYSAQFGIMTIGFGAGPVAYALAADHLVPAMVLYGCSAVLAVSAVFFLFLSAYRAN